MKTGKFVHDRKEMEEAKAKKGSTTVSSHASLNEHDAREMEEAAERRSRNEGTQTTTSASTKKLWRENKLTGNSR